MIAMVAAANNQSFGKLLTATLKRKKVSTRELARRLSSGPGAPTFGSRLSQIARWKRGENVPGPDQIVQVADALGVPVCELDPSPIGRRYREEIAALERKIAEGDELIGQLQRENAQLRERGFRPLEQPKYLPRRKQNG